MRRNKWMAIMLLLAGAAVAACREEVLDANGTSFKKGEENAGSTNPGEDPADGASDASDSASILDPVGLQMEAVDLGLSVKWARCNLGATEPEKAGSYYAWGEVETKSKYSWSTYKWGNSTFVYKYTFSNFGAYQNKIDSLLQLETGPYGDDAASYLLGGNWRTPTKEEWEELMAPFNCTWIWTVRNGVKGYKVESRRTGFTGEWVFLPASGDDDEFGLYWSSSLGTSSNFFAWFAQMFRSHSPACNVYELCNGIRCSGFHVRPVLAE